MEYSFAGGILVGLILAESRYMTENKYNIMIVEDDNTIAEKIKVIWKNGHTMFI